MNIDGIWKVEMLGIHGWDTVSTSYLENGRYIAGGPQDYAVGRYEVTGDQVVIRATLTLCGTGLTVFGQDSGAVEMTYEGQVRDGELQGGAASGDYRVHFRSTRVADVPAIG